MPTSLPADPILRSPLQLRGVTLRNRIVFGAHLTNFGSGNVFTERHCAYYAARAAGGAGMIVTEALTVHPLDWPYEHVPFGHVDGIVPSLAALLAALREAGEDTVLLAQLNHWGGQSSGKLLRQSPWAPSAVVEVASKRMARPMDLSQIDEVVAGFGMAAARVVEAGWDGVEVNAGQHALLRQFLSPLTNHRQDDYGGDPANRLRMPLRVIATVREAIGPGRVLGLKLCGDELAPWGGLTCEDAVRIAQVLVEAGGLDYLSVQIGGPYSAHVTEAAMPTPQAHAAHLAQAVREGLAGVLPVFAEGRIESPDIAEQVLNRGQADAVVMTRALISDPDLPRKYSGEHTEPIRPHIGMMRYFSVQGDWNRPLGDLIHPRAGRELELPPITQQKDAGPALVIGAGPAGMEAACTLARQGRTVTLREAADRLGGMAAVLARSVDARAEYQRLVDYYAALLDHLAVNVELGHPVRADAFDLEQFEAIVVAVGAQPESPPFAHEDGRVISARDLLCGEGDLPAPTAGRVAVVDSEYGFRMANAVEWLLAHGYGVDVISDDFFVGRALVESAEFLWFQRVAPLGVTQHPMLHPVALHGDTLTVRERFSGRERELKSLAFVVTAQQEVPCSDLADALRQRHAPVVTVGDARAPRLMGEAILNAHRTVLLELP